MWPALGSQGCGQARPPSRGAVRDHGREEMTRQQRLTERIQRLAQLCRPCTDARVSMRTAAPLGTEPYQPHRSRSPLPHEVRQRPFREPQAAPNQLPQPSADPAVRPTQSLDIDGAPATGRAVPQAAEEYATLLSTCSGYLDLLAQQYMSHTRPPVPGTACVTQAGLSNQNHAADLVAQVELACRSHDGEHNTTFASRLRRDLGYLHDPRAVVRPLLSPVGSLTRAGSPLPVDAALIAPCSPASSALARPGAEVIPVSPPRPISTARFFGSEPTGHATLSPSSSGRSPTLSPHAACRRTGMGTHRIAVDREPGVSPSCSPSSSLGSR